MVRAILDGRKTQTRRIIKPQPSGYVETVYRPFPQEPNNWQGFGGDYIHWYGRCQYGQPGDQLWVRETFCPIYPQDPNYNGGNPIEYDYAATYKHGDRLGDSIGIKKKWTPSIHMPRWASRIQLEITGIRVERLQDISEADALAEGIQAYSDGTYRDYNVPDDKVFDHYTFASPVDSYRTLWDTINGAGSWEANPWVWVIEFRRIKP